MTPFVTGNYLPLIFNHWDCHYVIPHPHGCPYKNSTSYICCKTILRLLSYNRLIISIVMWPRAPKSCLTMLIDKGVGLLYYNTVIVNGIFLSHRYHILIYGLILHEGSGNTSHMKTLWLHVHMLTTSSASSFSDSLSFTNILNFQCQTGGIKSKTCLDWPRKVFVLI